MELLLYIVSIFKESELALQRFMLRSPPSSEGHDRTVLTLPGKQLDLLQAVSTSISSPLIVVLMSGGPVDISWAKVVYTAAVGIVG